MARTTTLSAPQTVQHRSELIFAGPAVLRSQRGTAATELTSKGGETR